MPLQSGELYIRERIMLFFLFVYTLDVLTRSECIWRIWVTRLWGMHLSSISHPILGDPIYSRKDDRYPDATLMLHAYRLVFNHPKTKERMVFRAPLPDRFFPILSKEGIDWRSDDQCDSINI